MLDGHDRVALPDERLQGGDEDADVVGVEARRRLLEDVDRAARRRPGELAGQLDALGLAAGQGRRALAELEVAQAQAGHGLQDAGHRRAVGEQPRRLVHGHRQDVGDRPAAVADAQRLVVEAPALAIGALDVHVAEEVHTDPDEPRALAGLAPAAGDVE